jgi:hypothetical protein
MNGRRRQRKRMAAMGREPPHGSSTKHLICATTALGARPGDGMLAAMCGRVRLSSNVSEIKLIF